MVNVKFAVDVYSKAGIQNIPDIYECLYLEFLLEKTPMSQTNIELISLQKQINSFSAYLDENKDKPDASFKDIFNLRTTLLNQFVSMHHEDVIRRIDNIEKVYPRESDNVASVKLMNSVYSIQDITSQMHTLRSMEEITSTSEKNIAELNEVNSQYETYLKAYQDAFVLTEKTKLSTNLFSSTSKWLNTLSLQFRQEVLPEWDELNEKYKKILRSTRDSGIIAQQLKLLSSQMTEITKRGTEIASQFADAKNQLETGDATDDSFFARDTENKQELADDLKRQEALANRIKQLFSKCEGEKKILQNLKRNINYSNALGIDVNEERLNRYKTLQEEQNTNFELITEYNRQFDEASQIQDPKEKQEHLTLLSQLLDYFDPVFEEQKAENYQFKKDIITDMKNQYEKSLKELKDVWGLDKDPITKMIMNPQYQDIEMKLDTINKYMNRFDDDSILENYTDYELTMADVLEMQGGATPLLYNELVDEFGFLEGNFYTKYDNLKDKLDKDFEYHAGLSKKQEMALIGTPYIEEYKEYDKLSKQLSTKMDSMACGPERPTPLERMKHFAQHAKSIEHIYQSMIVIKERCRLIKEKLDEPQEKDLYELVCNILNTIEDKCIDADKNEFIKGDICEYLRSENALTESILDKDVVKLYQSLADANDMLMKNAVQSKSYGGDYAKSIHNATNQFNKITGWEKFDDLLRSIRDYVFGKTELDNKVSDVVLQIPKNTATTDKIQQKSLKVIETAVPNFQKDSLLEVKENNIIGELKQPHH